MNDKKNDKRIVGKKRIFKFADDKKGSFYLVSLFKYTTPYFSRHIALFYLFIYLLYL